MTRGTLDFTEPAIRDMVARNHTPTEQWLRSAGGAATLSSVSCDQCYEPWPCATLLALRNWRSRHPLSSMTETS